MKTIILGSAAGGGYPQWNCNCPVCGLYWRHDQRVKRRTQSSIAVSATGQDWAIFNCSPDIREQIGVTLALQPQSVPRHSPIKAAILSNADIDHIGGLISLRESQAFDVWATAEVLGQIRGNSIFNALNPDFVTLRELTAGKGFAPLPGLNVQAFDVPGKAPLYREATDGFDVGRTGHTKGFHVNAGAHRLSYVPGCGAIDDMLLADLASTDTLLFDGTLWTDDEMILSGTGLKTGRRMGHAPVSGTDGSMAQLAGLKATKRLFVHMNNTNPLLIDGSPQQDEARARGWTITFDGMEISP